MKTDTIVQTSTPFCSSDLTELRTAASQALSETNPARKVACVAQIPLNAPIHTQTHLAVSMGRPALPALVHPARVPSRGVQTDKGRGMLLHALAHIEFNAINLALDVLVRFANMPDDFYRDWLKVAKEEAYHYELLCERLQALNLQYGDYDAHDGLWQMAERTTDDLMARLALVPRLLEARGLDVSPAIRNRLALAGDQASANVLDIILRDEIGHVAIGNRWFNFLCQQRNLSPVEAFETCLATYSAPQPRSPFNFPAREQAGFSKEELAWLLQVEEVQQAEAAAKKHTNEKR